MRMMVGAIVLTLLTIHFRFAHGGSKKNPNIPRGSKINRGGSSKDKSSTGNSIDDTSNSDASSTLNGTALNQTTKWTPPLVSKPPETFVARKITQEAWNRETSQRIIEVKDPEFFSALLEPRSNAFFGFRWDGLDVGTMVERNSTNVTVSDNATTTSEPVNKRDAETPSSSAGSNSGTLNSANVGIYVVTGVLVAVCVVGLIIIFCVAKANGQRARDYEFDRRARRQNAGNTPAASGWRQSQDYLNEMGVGVVEERSADGNPAMSMRRMESDITDV